jgi:hypothetical protein
MSRRKSIYNSSKPLLNGHIRLVALSPGREDSKIKCRLYTANLSETPTFEALSYQWGESSSYTRDPTILLDRKKLYIRPNLWEAFTRPIKRASSLD